MIGTPLLIEAEVAEILRCSRRNVQRLRLLGLIRFMPGRPPRVDEADLRAYVDAVKVQKKPTLEPKREDAETDLAGARAWAAKKWQQRRGRERRFR